MSKLHLNQNPVFPITFLFDKFDEKGEVYRYPAFQAGSHLLAEGIADLPEEYQMGFGSGGDKVGEGEFIAVFRAGKTAWRRHGKDDGQNNTENEVFPHNVM